MTTYAGSVLATGIVTQFLKEFGVCKRIPTRLLSYVISLALLALADVFTCGFTLERVALIPINAMMVSLAANGAYDAVNAKKPPAGPRGRRGQEKRGGNKGTAVSRNTDDGERKP